MNGLLKKVVIYSVIGALQVGVYIGTIEASPKHHDRQDNNSRYAREHRDQEERARENHKREQEREQRICEEKERHEREMNRRHYESEREWQERQERERDHHEEVMRTIGGLAILYLILNDN